MFLNVKNLCKSYGTEEPVIKKLNFSIKKGEIISFIGESGSGKTTFLKCLAGLENIDSGLIELNGRLLNDHNKFVEANQRKLVLFFKTILYFHILNVLENIKFNLNKINDDELIKLLNLTALNGLEKKISS